jgi:4-amino-4-deoxy-L-arabinose transferase-like glycosyltransferase
MGIGTFLKNKYNLALVVLLLAFFLLMNYKIGYTLGYDESRHATQGHFFYDYLRTVLSGDFVSLRTFLDEYMKVGYNIGWPALIDPPAHAITQALIFMLVGASSYAVRLATMLLVIAGAFLLYFFAGRIFNSRYLAFVTVCLFLFYPYVFEYSRESIPDIATSFLMVGWFYYFFYKPGRYVSFVIARGTKIKLNLHLLIAAIFLAAATLMKYQNMIFAVLFVAIYVLVLCFRQWRLDRSLANAIVNSGSWKIIKQFFIVGVIFLLLGGWWLKFSLYDFGMFNRVFFEGMQRGAASKDYFFYVTETAKTTYFLLLFAIVPLLLWIRDRSSFLAQHWNLLLFMVVVYTFATFFISNQKIRYMIAGIPFLFMLIVQGINEFAMIVSSRLKHIKPAYLVAAITLAFLLPFAWQDVQVANARMTDYGKYNTEVLDYIKAMPDPKLLVYPKGGGQRSVNYYATPDLFSFEAMVARKEFNPKNMHHLVDIRFWDGDLENNPQPYFKWLNATSSQVQTAVFIFRYEPDSSLLPAMSRELPAMGFVPRNLTYFTVFEKK